MITGNYYSGKTFLKVLAIAIASVFIGVFIFEGVRILQNKNTEGLTVTVYNVGKGDCILVQQDGYAMMIDCGYQQTAGEITDYLKLTGIEPECVIITHYDKDHVGGAAAFADSFKTAAFYLPDYEGSSTYYNALMSSLQSPDSSHDISVVKSDISFKLGDASVDIYASDVEFDGDNDNDCSLVVSVRYGRDSYLFAGDLEKEGISAFLAAHSGQWDVIKMPHHGNKKGNVGNLLETVRPGYAIITDSGSDPATDDVLELLETAGAKIWRTSLLGTFYIKSSGSGRYTMQQAI